MKTETKLLAFHNDPAIKAKYIARVKLHAELDEIVQGKYWEDGKGCAVGCTLHSDRHSDYETELGIPRAIAYIEDGVFEALTNGDAKAFPLQFLEAIPIGANLDLIGRQFLIWTLDDPTWGVINTTDKPAIKKIVSDMADLFRRSITGDEPTEDQWNAVARAAWDAWAARAAWAAWATRAARAAWDAWAARAAWDARDAKSAEFTLAARDELLQLLRSAPCRLTSN